MGKGHYRLESVLLIITGLLYICWGVLPDGSGIDLIVLLWLALLGFLQVNHSIFIAAQYWNKKRIRMNLIIYWFFSFVDLTVFFFTKEIVWQEESLRASIIFILPSCLAIYLWYITYQFKISAIGDISAPMPVD